MAAFGADIGCNPGHAQTMKNRDSIPPEYWLSVEAAARNLGFEDITIKTLAEIASRKKKKKLIAVRTKRNSNPAQAET